MPTVEEGNDVQEQAVKALQAIVKQLDEYGEIGACDTVVGEARRIIAMSVPEPRGVFRIDIDYSSDREMDPHLSPRRFDVEGWHWEAALDAMTALKQAMKARGKFPIESTYRQRVLDGETVAEVDGFHSGFCTWRARLWDGEERHE